MSDFAENYSSPYLNIYFLQKSLMGSDLKSNLLKISLRTPHQIQETILCPYRIQTLSRLAWETSLWNLSPLGRAKPFLLWFAPSGKNPPQSFFAGLSCITGLLESSMPSLLFLRVPKPTTSIITHEIISSKSYVSPSRTYQINSRTHIFPKSTNI